MRRSLLLLAATCALIAAAACGGSEGASGDASPLAERWLRIGEEPQTSVNVYPGDLPPNLVDLLNPGADPEADPEDLVSFPVHPDGDLLGSYVLRSPDGVTLVWLIYDVPLDEREVEGAVAGQLDQSPWQATQMQANPTLSIVEFRSSTSGDIDGSAIIQPQAALESFELTVDREGSEQTLEFDRSAFIPVIEASIDDELLVNRVDGGAARLAGLEEGDRIVAVGGTAVTNRRELATALQDLATGEARTSALTYILQIQPPAAPDEEPFVLPQGRELPERFPARDAWAGLTVVEYRWIAVEAGRAYEAGMLGTEPASATAAQLSEALEAAGWAIVDNRASGFATVLEFAHEGEGLVGSAEIDTFPRDEDYTLVVISIQTAQ